MTDRNQFPTTSRSPGSRLEHQRSRPAAKCKIDRALHVLMAASAIVIGALLVQVWTTYDGVPSLAIFSPTVTATPTVPATATAMPTATATPGTLERAAQQIPLVQQAWESRDWKTAADRLNRIAALDNKYPGLPQARCDTYFHWAQDMEKRCQIKHAYVLYRQASSYCPDPDIALTRKDLALSYLSGRWRYDHNKWSQAAAMLHTVYERDPNYAAGCAEPVETDSTSPALRAVDARSLLYTSYVASSQELLDQGQIQEAIKPIEAALELAPESPQAIDLLTQIRSQLTPTPASPTSGHESTVEGKRIEVSISRQRMYVWQGDTLIYDWVCSTGGPGSGTATGRYRVQSKIPEAWASQWSLRMPYWLGIYNVGSLENGIHALPIHANGTTLWAGYLGTPVSYGCIILSTENARTLYQWADLGTPVWIDY